MNTFKHKSLYAAVAGLGALAAAGTAQAVSVNPNGLGQVLIYPYYTVRTVASGVAGIDAAYNSLLSVTNSTGSAKAVKVRFLEGKNSREVLDFNLYLSPKDVWTAAVIPTTDGAGIFTADKSCTVPQVSSSSTQPTPFVNYQFSGSNDDKAGTSLDRTREGYVEIIEMGDVVGSTATAATHVNGVPPCTLSALQQPTAPSNTVPGSGGLFGSMTLINVLRGEDFGYDPTALDGFSATAIWSEEGSIFPNLNFVNPKTSIVIAGSNVYITDWTGSSVGADPVSAVLMHNNVYNEFVLDASTKSQTDWVVTFPTKWAYYDFTTGVVGKLFQRNFVATGACDDVTLTQYDREERRVQTNTTFSPQPPTQTDSICWEANVISFNGTNALGSTNVLKPQTNFANGWLAMDFKPTSVPAGKHQLVGGLTHIYNTKTGVPVPDAASATFNGLPVIGFAAITFQNETLSIGPGAAIQSNYGGNFNHKVTTSVVTP
ncbi:MAG: hypothetical protein U1F48_02645 [Burkholderiales bacterium]